MENDLKLLDQHFGIMGKQVIDKVTGFKGIATSLSFDLYGCVQVAVTPKADKGREYGVGQWFDVTRLEVLKDKRVMDIPDYSKGYIAEGRKGAADKPAP